MSIRKTEIQKARRRYLDKCRRNGTKPISAEAFAKFYASKEARKARRTETGAKDAGAKGAVVEKDSTKKTHAIHEGDKIIFVNFTPDKIFCIALKMFDYCIHAIRNNERFVGNLVDRDFNIMVTKKRTCRKCSVK